MKRCSLCERKISQIQYSFGLSCLKKSCALMGIKGVKNSKAEEELNTQLVGISPLPLYTRIGLNTGEMAVGNMGSANKMNYTVMGNAVNLAARLEGINKQYQTGIIISEFTKSHIGEAFLCRQLDRIRVVGIQKPILIYELMGIAENAKLEELTLNEKWKEAITAFEERRFSQAADLFNSLAQVYPDGAVNLYKARCEKFLKEPPGDAWDGVFSFSEK